MFRLAQYDGLDTKNFSTAALSKFTDAKKISKWAVDGVAWAVANKIMTGVGNNKMSPKTTLSFEQLAQVMKTYGALKDGNQTPVIPSPSPDITDNSGSYYKRIAHPELAGPEHTAWLETYQFTDLSGPWDNCKAITELPHGGYVIGDHKYNKYGACIDEVDGLPNDEEKKAFILINQYRINLGLEPLVWDQAVQVVAETRAIESQGFHGKIQINDGQEGAHKRPNGDDIRDIPSEWTKPTVFSGKTFSQLAAENAFAHVAEYKVIYENEWGYKETAGWKTDWVVKGWIESPGHEAALRTGAKYAAVAYNHYDTDIDENGCWLNYWYFNAFDIH